MDGLLRRRMGEALSAGGPADGTTLGPAGAGSRAGSLV